MSEKSKILVVDDDPAALELIAQSLRDETASPQCVQKSREAALLVGKEKFDGIFLDWLMPEMDGLELARHISQTRINRDTPLVMLTSKTEPDAMKQAFSAGIIAFLTKPVTRQKVRRLLATTRGKLLSERRQSQRVLASLDVLCAWDGERVRGTTVDVGTSGILLKADKTPPEGIDITLALQLPGEGNRIELVGTVVRTAKGVGVGVRFTRFRPEDRAQLARFVEKMAETEVPREFIF